MADDRSIKQLKRDAAGFWGSAQTGETYYFTPTGRIWLVSSEDDLPEPRELIEHVSEIPDDIDRIDKMVTPEEAIAWCRQIQEISGEILLSD